MATNDSERIHDPVSGLDVNLELAAGSTPELKRRLVEVAVADGLDVTAGSLADAAVVTDAAGSLSGKLRGLVKILADVWDSTLHGIKIRKLSRLAVAGDYATATAATATVTYNAAGGSLVHVISGVIWSYNAAPSSPGSLTINDGVSAVRSVDITTGGTGFLHFDPPIRGTANTAMTIVLTTGGAGVVGKVSAEARWTE